MILGGVRVRNQNGWNTHCRDSGQGRSTGATDSDCGSAQGKFHFSKERMNNGFYLCVGVSLPEFVGIVSSCQMEKLEVRMTLAQKRQCPDHQIIDSAGTLTSPHHEE